MARRYNARGRTRATQAVEEGPYIETARAKRTPGRTVRKGGTQVIKLTRIKATIPIKKGALRAELGIKAGQKIPAKTISGKIATLKKKAAGAKKLTTTERKTLRRLVLARTMRGWRK